MDFWWVYDEMSKVTVKGKIEPLSSFIQVLLPAVTWRGSMAYVCVSAVSPTNCVSITSIIDIVVIVYFYFILAHNPRQNGSNN